MASQLTQLEQGAISATQVQATVGKCYEEMLHRLQSEVVKDPYLQLSITLAKNSVFNVFKLYFKDELEELGLNTELEYSKKPEK